MRRIGKIGKRKMDEKRAIKKAWFEAHGYKEEDRWWNKCQSCGRKLAMDETDYSHKWPAGRGGDKGGTVGADNGISSCRACHSWLEIGPNSKDAREALIKDKASFENNFCVQWSEELTRSLRVWHSKHRMS